MLDSVVEDIRIDETEDNSNQEETDSEKSMKKLLEKRNCEE